MKTFARLILTLVMALALAGCSLPGLPSPTPTMPPFPPAATKTLPVNTLPPLPTFTKMAPTLPPIATATPDASRPTLTASVPAKAQPTATKPAPTLPPPTATQVQPTATKPAPTQAQPTATKPAPTQAQPTATKPAPTQVQAQPTATLSTKEARIFFIALDDNGVSGKKIGCGDSVVGVSIPLAEPAAPLRSALEALLAVRSQYYGQSGLYNTLFRSDLDLESVTIKSGVAEIKLSGALTLGGTCDAPRVQAQLEETALQFATVQKVNIYINGISLTTLLSSK